MDNISRRRSSEEDGSCTTTSMYLSFDAESTMSSACYKTLEAMTDISSMSALSIIDDHGDNKLMNSTLENQDSQVLSPLKTVKKMDVLNVGSPLRALPKNIMKEYKALSSTPSREQLMKTVDVTRGSDASRCIDLGVAFLGIEDEKPAFFPAPQKQGIRQEENKENAIPENADVSGMSVSSSVDIVTSLSEKRFNSISTTGSLTGDESEAAISVIEKRVINSVSPNGSLNFDKSLNELKGNDFKENNVDSTPKAKMVHEISDVEMYDEDTDLENKNTVDKTPKSNFEGLGKEASIQEDKDNPKDITPKPAVLKEPKHILSKPNVIGKPKIAVLSSKYPRRSVCEPNLQTNRPSRIINTGNKRQSLLPVVNKKTKSINAETEIPLLMDKILKITNTSDNFSSQKKSNPMEKDIKLLEKLHIESTDKRRSLMPLKGRSSLMTSAVGEKRAFNRMSVVVKTTLNSPARKIARKSINNTGSAQRRSMVATKSTQTLRTATKESNIRRSMIPDTNKSNLRTTNIPLASIKEVPSIQQRNSMNPLKKPSNKESLKIPLHSEGGTVRQKIEQTNPAPFACSVCKEKFRIKSLLDAHKRSHEGDVALQSIRKPVGCTAANPINAISNNNDNKCKYCDKKFALVRALHIHLLQNCSKIPPSEKRKLEYTEMNHVEKAKLPSLFHHSTNGNMGSTQATPRVSMKQTIIKIPKATAEKDLKNLTELKTESQPNLTGNVVTNICSSTQKAKKAVAHSGVYRTPSKTVPCHICKLTFKSILDYTNHSLATHGSKNQE